MEEVMERSSRANFGSHSQGFGFSLRPLIPTKRSMSHNILDTAIAAGWGYGCSRLFTIVTPAVHIVNPTGGAIFGATLEASIIAINALLSSIGLHRVSPNAKFILCKLGSFAIATVVTNAAGFPITFLGAAGLTVTMHVAIKAFEYIKNNCCKQEEF
jgi:hypothetical protein